MNTSNAIMIGDIFELDKEISNINNLTQYNKITKYILKKRYIFRFKKILKRIKRVTIDKFILQELLLYIKTFYNGTYDCIHGIYDTRTGIITSYDTEKSVLESDIIIDNSDYKSYGFIDKFIQKVYTYKILLSSSDSNMYIYITAPGIETKEIIIPSLNFRTTNEEDNICIELLNKALINCIYKFLHDNLEVYKK